MSWFRGGGDDSSSSRSAAGVPGSGAFGGGGGPGLPPRRNPVQQQQPAAPQGGGGGYSQYSSQPSQSYSTGGYEKQQAGGGGGGGGVPGQMPHQAARHGSKFEVVGTPVDSYVLYNRLIVSPSDFDAARTPFVSLATSRGSFNFAILADQQVRPGTVCLGKDYRNWVYVRQQGDFVDIDPLDVDRETGAKSYLQTVTLELGFYNEAKGSDAPFDSEALEADMRKRFDGNIFNVNQPLIFEAGGKTMRATVRSVSNVDLSGGAAKPSGGSKGSSTSHFGIVMSRTEITFVKAEGSRINLKASTKRAAANAVVKPDFNFSDMGIGGLDDEFQTMFRRAFASRIFPPGLVEKLGISHVKGILLYGPPGTGKTLMARQIGKMLNAREPKIVNGPEVLNKFVGQSEENIRKLFGDAEKEYKAKGEESGLHIIIFDELDAICKQRGSAGSSTGVGDSVVNQLLSKMDGVDQLNNILIIGMTNRMDMIDEALLRAGRLEVHMEISLPDEFGRLQILNIHTGKMRENGVMAGDVDLKELAASTKNFSGAEINGLVKSATSFAFNRHVKVGTSAGIADDVDKLKVNRGDFMHALEEVKPMFGVAEEELAQVVQNGILHYAQQVESILRDGELVVKQVRESSRSQLVSVLMHGPAGAGKTALAATVAMRSGFPFIKLVSAENMVGFSEGAKITYINKVFTDSYRSPISVVVVDSIERIIDWTPIGARFSNPVLQALMVLMNKRPPKGRRLLVIATTSNKEMLRQMEIMDIFDADISVLPIMSLAAIMSVVEAVDLYKPQDAGYQKIEKTLQQAGYVDEDRVNIGVKRLLSLIEMARQDMDDPAAKLLNSLKNTMLANTAY